MESGADFEKRVTLIYQECKTTSDFTKQFKDLEKELEKKRNKKMDELKSIFIYKTEEQHNPHMQTMLRLVGFGDNAGSGFPTILDVWKSEGWIKPELIEDTNLDQVTLVMKMEKESDDNSAEKSAESAEKSADLKNREEMVLSKRHQQILAIMETGIEEYSTEQVAEKIGLKGPRTRQLLNELVNKELFRDL